MNSFLKLSITNAILVSENFKKSCRADALKDDGQISSEEERLLSKIDKCTDKYIKELNKLLEK